MQLQLEVPPPALNETVHAAVLQTRGPGCRRCQCPCGYGYVIIHTYIHTYYGITFWPWPVGRGVASAVQPVLPSLGASCTDVAVTLVAGIGGRTAKVAGLNSVARPLPLGELARVVA